MQVKIITDRYVHFDNNGSITKIARQPDENNDSIKIEYDKVKGLIQGKESLIDYKVEYDFLEKRHVLKHIKTWQQDQLKDAFMLEVVNDENPDVTILQDKKQKVWQLVFSKDIQDALDSQSLQIDPTLQYYSVTKKYDPNILYRLLKFKKQDDKYVVPFENEFELDNLDLSIYTARKFSSYAYEVIDG